MVLHAAKKCGIPALHKMSTPVLWSLEDGAPHLWPQCRSFSGASGKQAFTGIDRERQGKLGTGLAYLLAADS